MKKTTKKVKKEVKPGDMFNAMKMKRAKKSSKKKMSFGKVAEGAKLIKNVGKAFVRNATGADNKAILSKSKRMKKMGGKNC